MTQSSEETQRCSIWEQVDAVLVVNLATRPDRWERFLRASAGVLPPEKVHRVDAVLGRELPGYGEAPWFTHRTENRAKVWAGVAGCAMSHAKALALVRQHGWRRVLILEDDVEFAELGDFAVLPKVLEGRQEAFFLYLGYHCQKPYGTRLATVRRSAAQEREFWRVEGVLTTHAYMISASACEIVLQHMPTVDSIWEWVARYRAIDTFYRDYLSSQLGISVYLIWPALINQAEEESDIASGAQAGGKNPSFVANRPTAYHTLRGVLHWLASPWRRLKVRLNALRTLRRARRGGLPGYRSKRR